jgi:hypothetical protein
MHRSALLLLALSLLACREPERLPRASLSVAGALRTANDQGYARALAPRAFVFPRDHGRRPCTSGPWRTASRSTSPPTG